MKFLALITIILLALTGCRKTGGATTEERQDKEAKRLLQGAWLNDDGGTAAFLVRGDSLFFADNTSQPARVWIYQDSLYIQGANLRRYLITKQAEHLLKYISATGDEVKLTRSDGRDIDLRQFLQQRDYAINLTRVCDTDTICPLPDGTPVRVSIHTEPTSDRIMKSLYNDLGLEVDNMYLDNAATITLSGQDYNYKHTFRKAEFSQFVPRDFMSRAILQAVAYDRRDAQAVYLSATVGIPDAETGYAVEVRITPAGRVSMRLR